MYYLLVGHALLGHDGLHAAVVPLAQVGMGAYEGGLEVHPLRVESGWSLGGLLSRKYHVSLVVVVPRRDNEDVCVASDVSVGELLDLVVRRIGLPGTG